MTSEAEPGYTSVTMWLGWASLFLGCVSVLGIVVLHKGPEFELEGSTLADVVLAFFIPRFLGPCVALGSIGAAFAEGPRTRRTVIGLILAAAGAALPWLLWQAVCCGA